MSKAKLLEAGGRYAGKKLTDVLKVLKRRKSIKKSRETFKKTYGYSKTQSVFPFVPSLWVLKELPFLVWAFTGTIAALSLLPALAV